MAESRSPKSGYVKTQTLVFAVFLAFVAGFFSGIVLTILKSHGTPAGVDAGTAAEMDQARKLQEQIAKLVELTEQNPQDTEAWTRLGHAYFDSNQPSKAIAAYNNSLRLQPKNADVWTDLGVMYRRNHQPEEAVRAFDRAIEIDPKHEIARFNKGIVLIHDLKQFDAGIRAWKELVDINPMAHAPNGQTVDELIRQIEAQRDKS
ncbi:MAG: tetratricopeptide repeat protein [Desulfobacterales bacterium]|jgi:cytochrome c-type biogenesis protein CcmH/NrfG